MKAPAILGSIFLPPLGVFLDRGIGRDFWITVGLTCLAFLPGVAFALYTVIPAPIDGAGAAPHRAAWAFLSPNR